MTLKQYQRIKMAVVVITAFIYSQTLVRGNFIIPVAVLVVSILLLMFLRRNVSEIIADERDYYIGGKAAFMSLQIFSWASASLSFVFYAFRDSNSAYEIIGTTLAYSTCALLIINLIVYKYFYKFDRFEKIKYLILSGVVFVGVTIMGIKVFSVEESWICQDGQWMKHGKPQTSAPTTACR